MVDMKYFEYSFCDCMQSWEGVKLELDTIECDYRSIQAIYNEWTSLREFGGVWRRWYETTVIGFCAIFLVKSLRFAELVQAGGKP